METQNFTVRCTFEFHGTVAELQEHFKGKEFEYQNEPNHGTGVIYGTFTDTIVLDKGTLLTDAFRAYYRLNKEAIDKQYYTVYNAEGFQMFNEEDEILIRY